MPNKEPIAWIPRSKALYADILKSEGEQRLRKTLSAARAVTRDDKAMTPDQQLERIAGLDQIEAELLGTP